MAAVFKLSIFIYIFCLNGFVLTTERDVSNSSINLKNIKCLYLHSALTHMQLTKIVLANEDIDVITSVSKVTVYNDIVKRQISTLYSIAQDDIEVLWLLNIYTSAIIPFVVQKKMTLTQGCKEYVTVVQTHEFVIKYLKEESKNCNQSNIFYTNNSIYEMYKKLPIQSLIILIKQNIINTRNLLDLNNKYNILSTKNFELFIRSNLFLKTIVNKLFPFKFSYRVNVSWNSDVNDIIKKAYDDANSLTWSTDNFKSIKKFYDLIFGFFKIIILRLTMKHFLYLQFQNSVFVEDFALKWLAILEDFSKLTCFENDNDLITIASRIQHFISNIPKNNNGSIDENRFLNYNQEYYQNLISYISNSLTDLCKPFNCNANQPMFLFRNKSSNLEDIPPHDLAKPETVEYYSLQNTKKYFTAIKNRAKDFDLGIVRTFLRYINKLNTTTNSKLGIEV